MLHVGNHGLEEGLTVSGNDSLAFASGLKPKLTPELITQMRDYSFWS